MTDFPLLLAALVVAPSSLSSRASSSAEDATLDVDSAPLVGQSSRLLSTRAGYHDTCRTCFAPLALGGDPGTLSTPFPFCGAGFSVVVLFLLLLQVASWAQASLYVPKDEALQ